MITRIAKTCVEGTTSTKKTIIIEKKKKEKSASTLNVVQRFEEFKVSVVDGTILTFSP
jgi:hypothetical protein